MVITKIEHEGQIDRVESGPMDKKQLVYHADLKISGRRWEEQGDFKESAALKQRPPPFVNSLSMSVLLPTTAIMPSPAQRVRITLEFLPPEE